MAGRAGSLVDRCQSNITIITLTVCQEICQPSQHHVGPFGGQIPVVKNSYYPGPLSEETKRLDSLP